MSFNNRVLLFLFIRNLDAEKSNLTLNPTLELDTLYTDELETLQKILHFPEEVAIRLTDVECELFYSVPPAAYIQEVFLEVHQGSPSTHSSVNTLIKRFIEVI